MNLADQQTVRGVAAWVSLPRSYKGNQGISYEDFLARMEKWEASFEEHETNKKTELADVTEANCLRKVFQHEL